MPAAPEDSLSNRMEQAVLAALDEALAYHPDACRCSRCRRDIVALALRNLPARYAGSSEGTVVIDVELQRLQTRLEVFKALHQAISVVKTRPHHGRAG
ncbi:MAG: late competence development ComFB family protein [Bacillota bacterium]